MLSTKELEAIKRQLKRQEERDKVARVRAAGLATYAKKSNAKISKSQNSKAKRRDIYANGRRAPGSAFSRNG